MEKIKKLTQIVAELGLDIKEINALIINLEYFIPQFENYIQDTNTQIEILRKEKQMIEMYLHVQRN